MTLNLYKGRGTITRIHHQGNTPNSRKDQFSSKCQVGWRFSCPYNAHKLTYIYIWRLPKTYPNLSCPIFTIQKPIEGLNNDQVTTLSHTITAEAQKNRGSEMVFQVWHVALYSTHYHWQYAYLDCGFLSRLDGTRCQTTKRSTRLLGSANEPTSDGWRTGRSITCIPLSKKSCWYALEGTKTTRGGRGRKSCKSCSRTRRDV